MELECDECSEHDTKACLGCKYIQQLLPPVDRGKKRKECLSADGIIPPKCKDYPDYKTILYDNAKAIQAIKAYITCSDKHKAVFTLYLAGFNKTNISKLLTIDRSTVHRILAVFED